MPGEVYLCPKTQMLQGGVDEFSPLIEAIAPTFDQNPAPWHLDLSKIQHIAMGPATLVVAAVLDSRLRGRTARVTLPSWALEQMDFLECSGLNHHLNATSPPDPNDFSNLTVPIQQMDRTTFDGPGAVISLLRRNLELGDEDEEYLRICVSESIQNVMDHAKSKIGAVIGAQFYPPPLNMIEIAVVDCGIGIGSSLGVNNARSALELVVAGGHSAKSRPNNLGQGISNVTAITTNQLRGMLVIASENAIGQFSTGNLPRYKSLPVRFHGTGVFMSRMFLRRI